MQSPSQKRLELQHLGLNVTHKAWNHFSQFQMQKQGQSPKQQQSPKFLKLKNL